MYEDLIYFSHFSISHRKTHARLAPHMCETPNCPTAFPLMNAKTAAGRVIRKIKETRDAGSRGENERRYPDDEATIELISPLFLGSCTCARVQQALFDLQTCALA